MKENLIKLYNTMKMITTNGDNTLIMADCLRFCESLIQEAGKDEEELV